MPLPPLSANELRLGRFARWSSVFYAAFGALFLFAPELTFRLATLGGEGGWSASARLWQIYAVAMMASGSVACALVAGAPRERRILLVPVLVTNLASSLVALGCLAALGKGSVEAVGARAVFFTDLPLFLLTAWMYRAASTGANLGPTLASAPPVEPTAQAAPVKLGLGSAPKA